MTNTNQRRSKERAVISPSSTKKEKGESHSQTFLQKKYLLNYSHNYNLHHLYAYDEEAAHEEEEGEGEEGANDRDNDTA